MSKSAVFLRETNLGDVVMEGIGIVLQSIGALLIAYSQFEMNRTVSMYLQALDMTVGDIIGHGDIRRVSGLDQHWNRDLKRDKWLSTIGWILFSAGYFILLNVMLTRTG